MNFVRGPFIEYECSKCAKTVQENAPVNAARLTDLIADKNGDAAKRVCAPCYDWREN